METDDLELCISLTMKNCIIQIKTPPDLYRQMRAFAWILSDIKSSREGYKQDTQLQNDLGWRR